MQYTLAGFTHQMGVRTFAFVCTNDEKQKSEFRVRADLALIQRYGIRVQDLPLLCLGVLERRDEADDRRTFTYTEADMRSYAEARAIRDAEAEKKKVPRKQPPNNAGASWRDRHFSISSDKQEIHARPVVT